jgi:hypothetical protein
VSSELKFKRPGGIELHVHFTSGRYFVTVMYGHDGKWEVLANINAVSPSNCELHELEGHWSLATDVYTTFYVTTDEARHLQETFCLQVRHIPARVAS